MVQNGYSTVADPRELFLILENRFPEEVRVPEEIFPDVGDGKKQDWSVMTLWDLMRYTGDLMGYTTNWWALIRREWHLDKSRSEKNARLLQRWQAATVTSIDSKKDLLCPADCWWYDHSKVWVYMIMYSIHRIVAPERKSNSPLLTTLTRILVFCLFVGVYTYTNICIYNPTLDSGTYACCCMVCTAYGHSLDSKATRGTEIRGIP